MSRTETELPAGESGALPECVSCQGDYVIADPAWHAADECATKIRKLRPPTKEAP